MLSSIDTTGCQSALYSLPSQSLTWRAASFLLRRIAFAALFLSLTFELLPVALH
jgi:hypothetical protein